MMFYLRLDNPAPSTNPKQRPILPITPYMQCERLLKLAKSWYLNVRDETMAPARMISFMENHVADCPICREDPDIQDEIAKIREIILPESKIPKAVRMQNDQDDDFEDENEDVDGDDDSEEDSDVYDDDEEDFSEEPDLVDSEDDE